jgi:hypothetical protein
MLGLDLNALLAMGTFEFEVVHGGYRSQLSAKVRWSRSLLLQKGDETASVHNLCTALRFGHGRMHLCTKASCDRRTLTGHAKVIKHRLPVATGALVEAVQSPCAHPPKRCVT